MAHHPKAEEIARLGGGLLVPRQAAKVGLHVNSCTRCRKTSQRIEALREALAATNYPLMPDLVAQEIGLSIAIEISQRNTRKSDISWQASQHERRHGVARSAAGFIQFNHIAWAYRDKAELAARVLEYAEDGFAAGQYVELVGLRGLADVSRQSRHVARSRTVREALESGKGAIREITDFYPLDGEVVDAQASVARRIAASETARAAGFSGSRIIVDCTSVVQDPQQRDAFAAYEHLLDCQVLEKPIVALCAYDARALRLGAVAELACMHPYTSARATPFQLYAEQNAAFGLAGTLSDASVPLFSAALRRTGKPRGSELVIDARSAVYICRSAIAALNAHAQQMNARAVLRVGRSHFATLASSYPALTIEAAL